MVAMPEKPNGDLCSDEVNFGTIGDTACCPHGFTHGWRGILSELGRDGLSLSLESF
jgi:hypothetical protein